LGNTDPADDEDQPATVRKISRCQLQVSNLETSLSFYIGKLGMTEFYRDEKSVLVGYDREYCCLELLPLAGVIAQPSAEDFYWKIGITLPNLDAAVSCLLEQGVAVTTPRQFLDIGYMSKITDPDGLVIELLQRGFKGNENEVPAGNPVGDQATLAHITFRVTDMSATRQFFENQLSMRLMSMQPVPAFDFCLHFFTWSSEKLPEDNLDAVGNREWLWSRPYALIEIQHLQQSGAFVRITDENVAGFRGFCYREADTMDRGMSAVSIDRLKPLAH